MSTSPPGQRRARRSRRGRRRRGDPDPRDRPRFPVPALDSLGDPVRRRGVRPRARAPRRSGRLGRRQSEQPCCSPPSSRRGRSGTTGGSSRSARSCIASRRHGRRRSSPPRALVGFLLVGAAAVSGLGRPPDRRPRRHGGARCDRRDPEAGARMRTLAVAALAAALHLPAGYHATVYASGLDHPTAMSFGPNGRLYVSEDVGSIVSVARGTTQPRPVRAQARRPAGAALARPHAVRRRERQGRSPSRRRRSPRRRLGPAVRGAPAGFDRRRARWTALPRLGLDLQRVQGERPAKRGDPVVPYRRLRPSSRRPRPS